MFPNINIKSGLKSVRDALFDNKGTYGTVKEPHMSCSYANVAFVTLTTMFSYYGHMILLLFP